MSLTKTLKEVENKFTWTLFGFILALFFGFITVYTEFIKENKPDLNFIEKTNTTVLDIKENVGELDILYQGESLNKKNKDLKIITFEVKNEGDMPILQTFYDDKDLVGFRIENGTIADKPIIIETSNDYLQSTLKINKLSDNKALFSKVIMEPFEYFKIKLLILHDKGKEPKLYPIGKIANIQKIDIVDEHTSLNKEDILTNIFKGNYSIQISRLLIYGLSFVSLIIFLVLIIATIDNKIAKKRKEKNVETFKMFYGSKITNKDEFYINDYIISNKYDREDFLALLQEQYLLDKIAFIYEENKNNEYISEESLSKLYEKENGIKTPYLNHYFHTFKILIKNKTIKIKNDKVIIDEEVLSNLQEFESFISRIDIHDENQIKEQE